MEPINKDVRNKAILKAGVWTVFTLLILLFSFDCFYKKKLKVGKIQTTVGTNWEKEKELKDSILNLAREADSLLAEAIKINIQYLKESKSYTEGRETTKSKVDDILEEINLRSQSIKRLGAKSEEYQSIYLLISKLCIKLVTNIKESRGCCESPPKCNCEIDCPGKPCPEKEPCPDDCEKAVKKFKEIIATTFRNDDGRKIKRATVELIISKNLNF